jgi:hypothetical protein
MFRMKAGANIHGEGLNFHQLANLQTGGIAQQERLVFDTDTDDGGDGSTRRSLALDRGRPAFLDRSRHQPTSNTSAAFAEAQVRSRYSGTNRQRLSTASEEEDSCCEAADEVDRYSASSESSPLPPPIVQTIDGWSSVSSLNKTQIPSTTV